MLRFVLLSSKVVTVKMDHCWSEGSDPTDASSDRCCETLRDKNVYKYTDWN